MKAAKTPAPTLEILSQDHVATNRGLVRTTAIVRSLETPNVETVAIAAGWHPTGYGCYPVAVEPRGGGRWAVVWERGASCD